MDVPFATPVTARLDADGRIDQDLVCIRCGYNLRGLLTEGVCPECGTAVGRSLQGDLLRFAPPEWVETLARGMNWIVASIIIGILFGCLTGASFRLVGKLPIYDLVARALGIVGAIGHWMVATPDPGRPDEAQITARKVVRFTAVLNYFLGLVQLGVGRLDARLVPVAQVVMGLAGIVAYFAVFTYARQLALRIPNQRLAGQTRIVMWGLIATTTLMVAAGAASVAMVFRGAGGAELAMLLCPTGVGLLVFAIWSLVLIIWFRGELSMAARIARQTWARPMYPVARAAPADHGL